MRVGFVGDMHGSAIHALALLCEWTSRYGKLDTIIQLGDVGWLPDDRVEHPPYDRYYEWNKTIYDLFYLPRAKGEEIDALRRTRAFLGVPIFFIQGNHDNQPQYDEYNSQHKQDSVVIDSYDLFEYVEPGVSLVVDGMSILTPGASLHQDPHCPTTGKAHVDVLVTHQGPLGIGRNTLGEPQGGRNVLRLVKDVTPSFHIFGHHHHMIGPISGGATVYVGLDSILNVLRDATVPPAVCEGSLAVLDTEQNTVGLVTEEWVSEIRGNLQICDLVDYISED